MGHPQPRQQRYGYRDYRTRSEGARRDARKLDRRGPRGAPDPIVEVLSPGRAARDHGLKRDLHERAGAREYWLAHPGDRPVARYRLDRGRFGRPDSAALDDGSTPVARLPGVAIVRAELLARLPPLDP